MRTQHYKEMDDSIRKRCERLKRKKRRTHEFSKDLDRALATSSNRHLGQPTSWKRAHEILSENNVKKQSVSFEKTDFYELLQQPDSKTVFEDSRVFLHGLSTKNPQNDYAQYFVDTGKRGQNFIRDVSLKDRFLSYPKLRELIRLKDEITDRRRTPAFYLKADLRKLKLASLKSTFDVVLIDPPLMEYKLKHPIVHGDLDVWSWEELKSLKIGKVTSSRSFVFLWCGSEEGLEGGRECLKHWGFRRCEDVCWIKTNASSENPDQTMCSNGVLKNHKEHLLVGIKGTVRRNVDIDLIHSNIGLDVIVTEEPPIGSLKKPEEAIKLVEHFCLSRRRLYLFGNEESIRDGWLVINNNLLCSNYDPKLYNSYFENDGILVGSTPEIEQLRPRSPQSKVPQPRMPHVNPALLHHHHHHHQQQQQQYFPIQPQHSGIFRFLNPR